MLNSATGCLRSGLALGVAASALLFCAGAGAGDWPQYRGPNGDGVSGEEIVSAPVQLWSNSIGTGYSSVIVSGGRVYAMGHVETGGDRGIDTVYCFDADSGQELWRYAYNCRSTKGSFGGPSTMLPPDLKTAGPRATPVADGSSVYTLSIDGHLFCFEAASGEVVWYRNVEGHLGGSGKMYGFASSPVIYGEKLFLDIGNGLVALNKATGAESWRLGDTSGTFRSATPVVGSNGTATFVIFGSRYAAAAEVTNGAKLWQYDVGREAIASPILSAGGLKMFFSTYPDTGKVGRVDISGASPVLDWQVSNVMTYHMSNVLKNGYLYVMDNSGTEWDGHDSGPGDGGNGNSSLRCLDFANGSIQWTEPDMGWANIIASGDELVILRETGELRRLQPSPLAYTELGVYPGAIGQWCWTAPALAGGRLYCRNDKGDLVCFSVAPAVSIVATDTLALETSDTGTFTVRRLSADNSAALTVNITISGTEEAGEYTLTGGSITAMDVTIPAGQALVGVTVTPLADADTDDETVVVTLQNGAGYVVDSKNTATVYIVDATALLPEVNVAATDAWALEGGPDTGAFTFSRSAAASWPLVASISLGGTALPADYSLLNSDGATVIIPAGQTSATVTVRALEDAAADGDLSLSMTITANPTFYTIGVPSSATVTLVDDDDALVDSDSDGMDDSWELSYWGDLSQTGSADYDSDGLLNADEYIRGTDPTASDTDKDGSSDGEEVNGGANPLDPTSFTGGIIPPAKPGAWCAAGGGGARNAIGLGLVAAFMLLAWGAARRLSYRSR